MKKVLIGIWGILQGFIGTFWSVLGIACIIHPGSSPGTRDWEEDRMFIPVGYVMFAIWLLVMCFSYYKLRKNKKDTLIFSLTWLIGTLLCIYIQMR